MKQTKTQQALVSGKWNQESAKLVYETLLKKRGQYRNFPLVKYKRVCDAAKQYGVSVKDWILVQFRMMDREMCLSLFKVPFPPVNALSGPRARQRWGIFCTEVVEPEKQLEYLRGAGAHLDFHRACGEID